MTLPHGRLTLRPMNLSTIPAALAALLLAACAAQPTAAVCKTACSSHEEGYQWAQGANLRDPRACAGGYPESFIDGCRDGIEDLNQLRRATRSP